MSKTHDGEWPGKYFLRFFRKMREIPEMKSSKKEVF